MLFYFLFYFYFIYLFFCCRIVQSLGASSASCWKSKPETLLGWYDKVSDWLKKKIQKNFAQLHGQKFNVIYWLWCHVSHECWFSACLKIVNFLFLVLVCPVMGRKLVQKILVLLFSLSGCLEFFSTWTKFLKLLTGKRIMNPEGKCHKYIIAVRNFFMSVSLAWLSIVRIPCLLTSIYEFAT